jgi:uncharacterized protein with LGFP repeats
VVVAASGSQSASFVTGSVTLAPGTATAFGVWGPIYQAWQQHGGAGGELGYPVSNVFTKAGDPDGTQECDFQNGTITYDPSTGQITITLNPRSAH